MKNEIIKIAEDLKQGSVTTEQAQTLLLGLFSVTNSTLRKCCDNPDINEMESQNTDCDGDYETCTITYCKSCKQTLMIET